jgi:DNA processing protein
MWCLLALAKGDPRYPRRLLDLASAPDPLFARGELPGAGPAVAIVGSRAASREGIEIARLLAADLARAGVIVVSGGARGIDSAAHQGALEAAGPTIAVLPTPLDDPAPRRNAPLFLRIAASGGACVSEHAVCPPGRGPFAARNRIIAAMADMVIVVEAREGSGTQHTMRAARGLGRRTGAVPWALSDPRTPAFLEACRHGGLVIGEARDAASALGIELPEAPRCAAPPDLSPLEAAVVEGLSSLGRSSVDRLAVAIGAPVTDILCALTGLEVRGALVVEPAGHFRLSREAAAWRSHKVGVGGRRP